MIITHMERKIPKKRQKAKIHKTNQMMHKKNKKTKISKFDRLVEKY